MKKLTRIVLGLHANTTICVFKENRVVISYCTPLVIPTPFAFKASVSSRRRFRSLIRTPRSHQFSIIRLLVRLVSYSLKDLASVEIKLFLTNTVLHDYLSEHSPVALRTHRLIYNF